MVNFRFHVISLTAVFLALAIGIAVGATVVDRATVDALQTQLERVEGRVDITDAQNERLDRDVERWRRFAAESRDAAVAGRLSEVPVLIVGVVGIDRGPVEELRQVLVAAGARVQGTLWLTGRFGLSDPQAAADLVGLLDTRVRGAQSVRRLALARLADEMAADVASPLLVALRNAAFVEFEPPPGTPVEADIPLPGTRFVVVSGRGAEVPNEQLAAPLAQQLGMRAARRVLAAEAGREARPGQPGERALFVGLLRDDVEVVTVVSTVDNLEDFRGRFSAVFALRDLAEGKVGHYGVGAEATRLVPEAVS